MWWGITLIFPLQIPCHIAHCNISISITQDFKAIGIDKRGFKLRLEKAAKKLPSLPIETDIPVSCSLAVEVESLSILCICICMCSLPTAQCRGVVRQVGAWGVYWTLPCWGLQDWGGCRKPQGSHIWWAEGNWNPQERYYTLHLNVAY